MDGSDPHIHVTLDVVRSAAAVRDRMAATWGLVADLPSVVTTGCGRSAPFAMTSARPEKVTCLACREHAGRQHRRYADQLESLARMPGAVVSAAQAAAKHRDLAARFSTPPG
jgi:hypothetical protein